MESLGKRINNANNLCRPAGAQEPGAGVGSGGGVAGEGWDAGVRAWPCLTHVVPREGYPKGMLSPPAAVLSPLAL